MQFGRFLSCFLALSLGSAPLQSQDVNMARPTEMSAQHHATPEEIRDRAANGQFQKDIKELSDLCASVPHDMDGLKQGVLSKEAIDKLKRMEKLSKHIREQLTRN
jgi:hypothetical protein